MATLDLGFHAAARGILGTNRGHPRACLGPCVCTSPKLPGSGRRACAAARAVGAAAERGAG
eukprot:7234828-Pyramimonas_sp.AAC.1